MMQEPEALRRFDPFDIFDTEAERLDRYFSSLDEAGWSRPSRCEGWSVRDVLAHLAGEELYNQACLDKDLDGFYEMLEREGVQGGFDEFNRWCVRKRRSLPVDQVLEEWRTRNRDTRRRMRELGRDGLLHTSVGPYPAGLQAFHYASEYATHADDVGAPVAEEESARRLEWRAVFGLVALAEHGSAARGGRAAGRFLVRTADRTAELSPAEFVDATVARLPAGHPLDPALRSALRCLA
ncbi:MAG: maleylpyruvate isomerase family mycothiol-dependent enzyme [Thermobispora bispora]|nr:maleylpyruvate isomerase family mycothiol-dependent enzyme [Thermobispora bispora]